MRPDEIQQNGRVGTPQPAARSFVSTPPSRDPQYRQQEAAANIIRAQLDSIYAEDPTHTENPSAQPSVVRPQVAPNLKPISSQPTPAAAEPAPQKTTMITQPELEPANPYERTHTPQTNISAQEWKKYHSAWQDYYKRYYEGYYTQQLAAQQDSSKNPLGSNSKTETSQPAATSGPITEKQAIAELKSKLLRQVEERAGKVRRSRHFGPVLAALGVLLIFGFLQYNQVLIANVKAYITPGNIDPQNIIVDPSETVKVGPEARLVIPKINIDTPVFYDIPTDKASQDKAMENGVAHFPIPGANSHPGEIGNTVLSGHSSNDVFAPGDYKFIFMQLDKLEVGDTIYANYEGTRYTYVITGKKEVFPNEVSTLIYPTDKPEMTLITCTPLGTALKRLLVTAEQVYPTDFKPAPQSAAPQSGQSTIPGQGQPSIIERAFGRQ